MVKFYFHPVTFSYCVNFREADWKEWCIRIWSGASWATDGKEACREDESNSVPINCDMGTVQKNYTKHSISLIKSNSTIWNFSSKMTNCQLSFSCNVYCILILFYHVLENIDLLTFKESMQFLCVLVFDMLKNHKQAMPQLTDRTKLPNIVDPVIRDTMDPKHLYQVLFW